jgi:hypothetical protein
MRGTVRAGGGGSGAFERQRRSFSGRCEDSTIAVTVLRIPLHRRLAERIVGACGESVSTIATRS